MPGPTALFQERILNALEATQAAQEAIQASQATIAAASAASYNVTYVFPLENWDTEWTQDIITPAGKRARVVAVNIYAVTESFVDTTTDARIDIGVPAGDADAYATTSGFGTLAAGDSLAPVVTQGVTEIIPVDTVVTITGVEAGVAGNGIATAAITLEYFD